MRAALVLVIVAVGIGAALFSRFAGLLAYLWFAFFRPQEWAWGDIDALHLSLVVGAVFVIPCLVTGVFPTVAHPLSLGMIAFLCCGVVSQLGATDWNTGLMALDQLGRMVLVSLLMITLVNTRKRFVAVVLVVAGSIAFHGSKFGVGYLIRGGARFDSAGIGGMFSDNNDFALAIARCLFLLAAAAALQRFRLIKFGVWVALPLNVLAIVSTYSRGGALAAVAGGGAYLILHQRKKLALGLLLVAVLAFGTIVPIDQQYVDRLRTVQNATDTPEASIQGRLHFWRVAWLMGADRPLGVGLKNYPVAYDRYDNSGGRFGTKRAVHSSHFQVLAELGALGIVVWLWLHGAMIWLCLRVRRRAARVGDAETRSFYKIAANGLIASEVAFLVGGAFLAQALNDLNWVTIALVASLDRLSRTELEPQASAPLGPRGGPTTAVAQE